MRLVVYGASRLAFYYVSFEFSPSFLQKYECILRPPAALSDFLKYRPFSFARIQLLLYGFFDRSFFRYLCFET